MAKEKPAKAALPQAIHCLRCGKAHLLAELERENGPPCDIFKCPTSNVILARLFPDGKCVPIIGTTG